MKYLFDTNVVSQLAKQEPHRKVAEWLSKIDQESFYISVITVAEIRNGVDSLPEGKKRQALTTWLERDLPMQFAGRVLAVDLEVADRWGNSASGAKGPFSAMDGLISATALVHRMELMTRNTRDFAVPGLRVINPWSE